MAPTHSLSIIIVRCDTGCLDRALRSVQAQLYPAQEVLVVDRGGQADRSFSIEGWKDRLGEDFRYLRLPDSSEAQARNFAVKQTTGDLILFLNPSDELLPLAVEYHTHNFRRYPWADACFGRIVLRDEIGNLVPSDDGRRPDGMIFDWLLTARNCFSGSAFVWRRPLFAQFSFDNTFRHQLEADFLLRIALHKRFCCVQEDVAIAEPRESMSPPEAFTERCRFVDYWMRKSREPDAERLRELRARLEYEAGLKWYEHGDKQRAGQHAIAALQLAPWNPRYWMLAGRAGARQWLSVGKRPLEAA